MLFIRTCCWSGLSGCITIVLTSDAESWKVTYQISEFHNFFLFSSVKLLIRQTLFQYTEIWIHAKIRPVNFSQLGICFLGIQPISKGSRRLDNEFTDIYGYC